MAVPRADAAPPAAHLGCPRGCSRIGLDVPRPPHACPACGALLEVTYPEATFTRLPPAAWAARFAGRHAGLPGPAGSGVWRFREWVLPHLTDADIVSRGEGHAPLTPVPELAAAWDVELWVKQCGHGLTGSFKDLGMTVLVSQARYLQRCGHPPTTLLCASTGDTSAALAAYAAAAGLPAAVLLPAGMVSAAQLLQPLAHGARVVAIDGDFDACMRHVQALAAEPGVTLANSKNPLRLEGQKTVALEILAGLGWTAPDWVCVPGGNLGNVAALERGFAAAQAAGLTAARPRLLCAQAAQADPLYQAFAAGHVAADGTPHFAPLRPQRARPTQASAIRIGAPVSFGRATAALQRSRGRVAHVDEADLQRVARAADHCGLYVCPHTAVALAAVQAERRAGHLAAGARVVVVATAHGLKFGEFKAATLRGDGRPPPPAADDGALPLVRVADDFAAVRRAALG